MPVKFVFQLSEAEEASLRDLLKGGKAPVRTITNSKRGARLDRKQAEIITERTYEALTGQNVRLYEASW